MPIPSPQLIDALSRYQPAVRRLNAAVELGADREEIAQLTLAKNQAFAALRERARLENQQDEEM